MLNNIKTRGKRCPPETLMIPRLIQHVKLTSQHQCGLPLHIHWEKLTAGTKNNLTTADILRTVLNISKKEYRTIAFSIVAKITL